MARKQVLSEYIKDIRKALEEKKAIIGLDRTLKALKAGTVTTVYVANNVEENTFKDLEKYTNLSNIPLIVLNYANDEIGTLCKRQHYISVLSIGA